LPVRAFGTAPGFPGVFLSIGVAADDRTGMSDALRHNLIFVPGALTVALGTAFAPIMLRYGIDRRQVLARGAASVQGVLVAFAVVLAFFYPRVPNGGGTCPNTSGWLATFVATIAVVCGAVGAVTLGAGVTTRGSASRLGFVSLAIFLGIVALAALIVPSLCDHT
jgi:hypothetical protein